jgi:hypothetical protein
VGYIDDIDETIVNSENSVTASTTVMPYLGKLYQLEAIFQQQHIDEVLIALPQHEQSQIRKMYRSL